MSDNIKVVVKVRPLISREIEEKLSYQWRVKNNTLYQLDQNGKDLGQSFTFDKVYDKDTKTSDVYNDIAKPIVQAATAGFNGTIFAYGQTSSGKTYTMTGTERSPGIIPLAVLNLFEIIKNVPDRDFLVRVSYIEIYNETVKDLLNVEKDNIKVHESLQGIKVDATEKVTSSPEEVLEAMKEGEANRQKGATNMNEQSSRSHSIFQITIESREHIEGENEGGCVNVSQLNLVDLAGSERAGQTGATGLRFKEGTHINKSLSALALVIKQLSEDPNKYANYRDSKLTRILQNSLGGNAKTSIICAVTPAAVEETISTLQFANRAKAIKNKPEVNAVATDATMIQRLTKQMSKLQSQLESKKNLEQDNYNLQKQITALQKLILNGFGQRRSIDMMQGTRRKLQQPRRVTIHSTLSTIEDESIVDIPIPKFCTPSLKYNPSLIPNPSEFVPIQSLTKLPSVPEEPVRLTTPPPHRTVNFNDEVIELDSDDESMHGDHETCSPIHKCYGASKTPPCILRKNAKLAERNLRDIVELTEREKIFSPSAVELMEKLEQNATLIAELQDKIEVMNTQSKEKDLEVDVMKSKLKQNEDELRALYSAKVDLQTQCDNYSTKLTDWEVSYETLKVKAKLREEELLSLLDEIKVKKTEEISKIMSRTLDKDIHFMDMSKEISLVNSDHENSVNPDNEIENINNILTNSEAQLASKTQNIIELEANIFAHQQKIASLENLTQELEQTICTFKEKLANTETENSLLKSLIDTLNTTISNQKATLQSVNNDIESYNNVIQELQIKLTQRETFSKMDINDSVLENMVANEKQFIANNENMFNIIQSFKNAIQLRNNEIAELKNKVNNDIASDRKDLLDQLQSKTEELSKSNIDVDDLKKKINENVALINKLMHEQGNYKIVEQELSAKLVDIKHKKSELEKVNNDNALCIQQLKEEIDRLKLEKDAKDEDFAKQIEEFTKTVADLEESGNQKDDLISSLNKDKMETEEILLKAKTAVLKSRAILGTLSGTMNEVPELIDNFVNVFSALSDSLNTLETVACDIVKEKLESDIINNALKAELEQLHIENKSEITAFKCQIENFIKTENDYKQEKYISTQTINKLNNDLQIAREELNNRISANNTLEVKLNETIEKQGHLEQIVLEKDTKIDNLTHKLEEMETVLKEKISEITHFEEQLNEANKTKEDLLADIFVKITDVTENLNIETYHREEQIDSFNIHQQILLTIDKIGNHTTLINLKNVDDENNKISEMKNKLNEANKEITELTQKNSNLKEIMFDMEMKNNELLFEVEKNRENNLKLSKDLTGSQHLLGDLQIELRMKAAELGTMQGKVQQWKDQFINLDSIMKEQTDELRVENESLKSRLEDLNRESELSIAVYEHKDACSNGGLDASTYKRVTDLTTNIDINSPPSLLTICCNKIVDSLEPKEIESKTTTITDIDVENRSELNNCKCYQLTSELNAAREENARIIDLLAQMEMMNQHLLEEQDIVRREIKLLVQPAQELQKKVLNHRTNLSILTATTYAENKSLKSQVKVLQHHHKRFHNVCQRDIPDFKKQLSSLMTLLKGEPATCDQNLSFKRYSLPDVLDSSTALPTFKNESTLDGDLLMLDTNITLTTAADNTIIGHDQTCLDITQYYTEASSQTNDFNQTLDNEQQNMYEKLSMLNEENTKLREVVDKYLGLKLPVKDAQISPIKNGSHLDESIHKPFNNETNNINECANCKDLTSLKISQDKLNAELKHLADTLNDVKIQKAEVEQKYNNLILETPTTDALVKKLTIYEKEYNNQKQEIAGLNQTISIKTKELKSLQEENDTLSDQLMENISKADDLNKELNSLKQKNIELVEKCSQSDQSTKQFDDKKGVGADCPQCAIKDELILTMQSKVAKTHTKLNRSLSDSDTSSRYNKICTLQSELHAGREDCKELTEDVVTIKNHLERSDLSMELDESMTDVNIYTVPEGSGVSSPQSKKCRMPDIPEERTNDIYTADKMDCFNFYVDKTGAQIDSLNRDTKIIEIMKRLFENLITKHGNEVENLSNKLKVHEEAKIQLQNQYYTLVEKQSQLTKDLEETYRKINNVANTLSQLSNIINNVDDATNTNEITLVNTFKENLTLLDSEFELSSAKTFECLIDSIVNKHQANLSVVMDKCTKLQEHIETVTAELNSVNNNLMQMKTQLSAKEDEYNLLKAQKDRVHEITNAVTLDIVKREKELKDTIDKGYRTLIERNIVKPESVDSNLPLNTNINVLFNLLVTQSNLSMRDKENEKETLMLEINILKTIVDDKQREIDIHKTRGDKLQEVNNGITLDLIDKENKLLLLNSLYEEINKAYESKMKEDKANIVLIGKLTEEINMLKTSILEKGNTIEILEKELAAQNQSKKELVKMSELIETVKGLQDENAKLKALNEMINKEKDTYAEELNKSSETIKKNNTDLDKMMSDILVLRESVKENGSVIENLSAQTKSLLKQNLDLKEQLDNKCKECSRLETNIKTHEKTAQIQTRMIMRLEKQKSEDDKTINETKKQLEESSQKCQTLQMSSETYKTEVEQLRKAKEALEARISELEATLEGFKNRPSIDVIGDTTRRRRQSLHDSKRTFAEDRHEIGDHNSVEAIFDSRSKPDDLFMDVDEAVSNRSTPIRLSKGRDSLSHSRTDQTRLIPDLMISFSRRKLKPIVQGKILSDKDDEHSSRPSSVLETRRRRQTIHDSHRNELSQTPSPYGGNDGTASQLRERLASCQQELEELKEKYKELDEECETCSEYLRESEKQCARLKKEKQSLQTTITELKEKLQSSDPSLSQMFASKPKVAHASVNTDEDWTNLHSVVVDRMSYDAEVEKNKKLTKTIEELRFKKQELKNTLGKMQKALEKHSGNRELELTKQELQACKQELTQLKERYKELDEECETCAQYMREKEEQCRRLKEAKTALETKLQELQSDMNRMTLTTRKKRQTIHDQNRASAVDIAGATTETSDDFLNNQVERDDNTRTQTDEKQAKEVKHLKLAVERLSQQKMMLEQQLASVTNLQVPHPAMYVATGSAIVQNQQITDVMKENQKLKKINAKLINICKKRGKDSNRENEDPANQG